MLMNLLWKIFTYIPLQKTQLKTKHTYITNRNIKITQKVSTTKVSWFDSLWSLGQRERSVLRPTRSASGSGALSRSEGAIALIDLLSEQSNTADAIVGWTIGAAWLFARRNHEKMTHQMQLYTVAEDESRGGSSPNYRRRRKQIFCWMQVEDYNPTPLYRAFQRTKKTNIPSIIHVI